MQIQEILLKDLKPYERNAKKHDNRQIENVAESIKQFGFAQPLVVDKDNVVIIQRWEKFTGRKNEIFCIRDGQRLTYDEVFDE